MTIPLPQEFAPQVHAVASQKMLDDGRVYPMLFLGEMGKPMLICSVVSLMQNDNTKDVLSLLPAYLGVLKGGLDFVSFISESWAMTRTALVKEFGTEKADDPQFVRQLVSQYGGVSMLPENLRNEVVHASIDVAGDSYFACWNIQRDESGKPSLADYESCVINKVDGSGRLIGMLGHYHKLKKAFDELSVVLNKETGQTLTLEFLAGTLSKIENTDAHVKAYSIASSMLASMASLPSMEVHASATPPFVQ